MSGASHPYGGWDGRPENPDVSGWHWLAWPDIGSPEPCHWNAAAGWWFIDGETHRPHWVAPQAAYLGPCPPPSEIHAGAPRRRALGWLLALAVSAAAYAALGFVAVAWWWWWWPS